ncbi:hypothetical protein QBC99_002452 [Beijerinckia sp. GAS462]|nr:hypothetical protein [Beijerinckia sp. GAS462]SEC43066.1 hypothetical protein SAMN05443249_2672 [Beijerinckia sp. 28-YEA-48]
MPTTDRDLLHDLVEAWPEFDDDETPVNGADLVEWFAGFREQVKAHLAEPRSE